MANEQRSVKLTREELESIIYKNSGPAWGSKARPLLYGAVGVCVLLLIVMALPQTTVDGWVQRLESGSQAVSQSSLVNPEKLDLVKLDDEWSSQSFEVSCIVRNRTNEVIRGGEAVIKLYGRKGIITTLVVELDASEIGPNQRAGFRTSYKLTPDTDPLTHYEISFKRKDGTPLLHQDLRGAISGQ